MTENGGKVETTGMHASSLLRGAKLMGGGQSWEDNGRTSSGDETNHTLHDYIIQSQAMNVAMSMADPDDGWKGPQYTVEHVYAIDSIEEPQLTNDLTNWDSDETSKLTALRLPKGGEGKAPEQAGARRIVEQCLTMSFGFRLAHGLILGVLGQTLGSLWRQSDGPDDHPSTYAHFVRHGVLYWT